MKSDNNKKRKEMISEGEVILINYTGRKGGGALDAYEMTKALADKGCKVAAVISAYIENIDMWRKLDLVKLVEIPTYTNILNFAVNTTLFGVRQKRFIEKQLENIDVKYIFAPMMSEWTERINKIFPKAKKVLTIHDPIPHSGNSRVLLIRKLFSNTESFKKADALAVHTKKFIPYVEDKYGEKDRVYYIPLGRHNMYRNIDNKTSIIKYDPDKINFLFFGRISRYKGLDILAQAYKKVHSINPDVTLSVVGNGDFGECGDMYKQLPDVTVINRWIQDCEVESVFTGENLVNICPYKDATQSGVIMLAQDYAVPVIATNTGGIDEQIKDGETGLLLDECNADELAEKMLMIAKDRDLYNHLAEKTKAYIEDVTWEKSAETLLDIFDRI